MPADDPRALVAEAREQHEPINDRRFARNCVVCKEPWPCLPARLADQLERALKREQVLRDMLRDFAGAALAGPAGLED